MVAIDIRNGYRDMILPMAERDETLRNAVLAVSASHFSLHYSKWNKNASKYHMAAIHGLNQRPSGDLSESLIYSDLSTMVVLLVEEMVTVGQDFHILLRMIGSFIESQGGPEKVEASLVGKFLMQEIRKYVVLVIL